MGVRRHLEGPRICGPVRESESRRNRYSVLVQFHADAGSDSLARWVCAIQIA